MSKDNPSISDLTATPSQSADWQGAEYKVQKTLTDVNRDFEELEVARRAATLGYGYLNLKGFPLDKEALGLITAEEAEDYHAIPFSHDAGEVKLGVLDPTSKSTEEIRRKLERRKYSVRLYLISSSSFSEALAHFDEVKRPQIFAENKIELKQKDLAEKSDKFKSLAGKTVNLEKTEISEVISQILSAALLINASDIHFEPGTTETRIRLRVDGVLQDFNTVPSDLYRKLITRIKILAKLKLNVSSLPQDGSFGIKLDDNSVDLRVAVLPSVYAEALVLRILKQSKFITLDELGLLGNIRKILNASLQKTTGMILTTGPTGSGKTTTLYALLKILNKPGLKIITVEDPVEYKISGISQTPIDKNKGMNFATSLKAILRQDPDIVMVGEIRDEETAETAVQAALTGHLMLSTLHTNDALSIIPRLLDLEVKPYLITGSLNLGIAQRLVRRLCRSCKHEEALDEATRDRAEKIIKSIPQSAEIEVPKELKFFVSPGCEVCGGLGYKGRVGIFEAFTITPDMEKLILRQAPLSALRQQAVQEGMLTMVQDGLLKALQGLTDVYEVFRVTD